MTRPLRSTQDFPTITPSPSRFFLQKLCNPDIRLKISFPPTGHARILWAMRIRRWGRERAVQFLFQHELNPSTDLEKALDIFWDSQRSAVIAEEKAPARWGQEVELPPPTDDEAAIREFGESLIRGALEQWEELDATIMEHAKNWDILRIANLDRNILRLAIYEMLHRQDIPPVVSINEAIDIAKKFSTEDSGRFVNGILDKVRSRLMRSARTVTQ